ncbi:transposase [candidate division KSB1 bacterium]|nr:transposase [candidate division KSB1 bacterium]
MSEGGIRYRFRSAFKQKVILEFESGKLTIAEARKIYDIRSQPTIYEWLGKYGKNHLI